MLEMILYAVGFLLITLILQYLLSKRKNKGVMAIWQGTNTVIVICILGIVTRNINYLAAVLGFVIADEIGKSAGWHN